MAEKTLSATISIKLIPRSKKNELVEIMENGTIKIRLTAPPVDGKANQALMDFLSVVLKIKKEDIAIISGQNSRNKLISIRGIEEVYLINRIKYLLSNKTS